VVVVGGGSAGCVAAARLSEDPGVEVLLIEAGPDHPDPEQAPADIVEVDLVGQTDHDWGYVTEDGGGAREGAIVIGSAPGTVALLRGRVLGGSSAINAGNAMRSLPWDFQRWAELGNPEWSWATALDGFRRLEDDPAPGDWHGRSGPFPVRRYAEHELGVIHQAFVEAAVASGHGHVSDHNAPDARGVGVIPMNRIGRRRMNAAWTHLTPEVRSRPNLRIAAGVEVDRLEIDDGIVRAVHAEPLGRLDTDVVVLAAGSIGSPAILLRSGVGDPQHLGDVGVEVRHKLPGVGRGLREHPATAVVFAADAPAVGPVTPLAQTLLTASSGLSGDAPIDLNLIPLTMHSGVIGFAVGVMRPAATGSVLLRSPSPADPPRIHLGLFAERHDLAVASAGVAMARALAATPPLRDLLGPEVFPATEVTGAALDEAITATPNLYYHASGTCRMGPSTDPDAVVDAYGSVRGLTGLRVVDASIFPDIPSVPTNATTMMVADRCARYLLAALS
jgi:choline dehydrogenase